MSNLAHFTKAQEERVTRHAKKVLLKLACQAAAAGFLLLFTHTLYLTGRRLEGYNREQGPMIIGHRGVWMDGVPECSFEAVRLAKKYGFHGVEFDVRLSKDNELVVMHDVTLERTTDEAAVQPQQLTFASAHGLRVGDLVRQGDAGAKSAKEGTVHSLVDGEGGRTVVVAPTTGGTFGAGDAAAEVVRASRDDDGDDDGDAGVVAVGKLDAVVGSSDDTASMTLAQLRTLTLTDEHGVPSAFNETVPTLREYLDYMRDYDDALIAEVELKQLPKDLDMVTRALDDICASGMAARSFIATCEYRFQNILNAVAPQISVEKDFLFHTSPGSLLAPSNANIIGINAEFLLFNPWLIPNSHKANQGVMVYFLVLESSFTIQLYQKMGVDYFMINDGGICTDAGLCPATKPYVLQRVLEDG